MKKKSLILLMAGCALGTLSIAQESQDDILGQPFTLVEATDQKWLVDDVSHVLECDEDESGVVCDALIIKKDNVSEDVFKGSTKKYRNVTVLNVKHPFTYIGHVHDGAYGSEIYDSVLMQDAEEYINYYRIRCKGLEIEKKILGINSHVSYGYVEVYDDEDTGSLLITCDDLTGDNDNSE